ncbi:MAG: MmcQ/YjbR family DNA-binding protein [Acidimicrobiales bacterium]
MVTMRDVEEAALSMPETQKEVRDDRPAFVVDKKLFCFHRTQRRDAVDATTGERLDDVLAIRVADEEMKSMWLAERPSVFFTTDHFNGHPWILLRIPSLAEIDHEELSELISDAWLARAPSRLAQRWLEDQGQSGESG